MPLVRFKPKPVYVPNVASKFSLNDFDRDNKPGKPEIYPTPSVTPIPPTPSVTPSMTPSETPTPTVTPTMTVTPSMTPPTPQPNIFSAFISNWTADSTIELPYSPTGTYSGVIDWGDGNVVENTYENRSHTYQTSGNYTIIILGEITGWNFGSYALESANNLLQIIDWGTVKGENGSNEYMFANCNNLTLSELITPIDLTNVTSLKGMFLDCFSITDIPLITSWDTSNITDMSEMFKNALAFNGDITNWDVSNVTNMSNMFNNCETFNKDISEWDVSSVTDMSYMFNDAVSFNQPIGNWSSTSSVTNMSNMFENATIFNQNIGSWDVSNVTNMSNMFSLATSFDNNGSSSIGEWNTSSCGDFSYMFANISFNQPIGTWNISSATTISGMFFENSQFNQDLGSWDTSNVTDASYVFYNATSFNQDLSNWSLTKVTNLVGFLDNSNLSQKNYDAFLIGFSGILIQNPNQFENNLVVGVNGLTYSQSPCPAFSAKNYLESNFNWTFVGDTAGNCIQFISVWELNDLKGSNFLSLPYSPTGTYSGVIDWGDGLYSINSYKNRTHDYLGTGNFTVIISGEIEGWNSYEYGTNNLNLIEIIQWGNLKGENGSNQSMFFGCSNLTISNVTDTPNFEGITVLDGMFNQCSSITTINNIDGWDVSNIQSMSGLFQSATNFDSDISAWNVSAVTSMNNMFLLASSFNQDISGWNVSGVTNMDEMFSSASSFNQDLSSWCVSQIPSQPSNFDANASSWVLSKPIWGTCP